MASLTDHLSARLCQPSPQQLVHLATHLAGAYDLDALDALFSTQDTTEAQQHNNHPTTATLTNITASTTADTTATTTINDANNTGIAKVELEKAASGDPEEVGQAAAVSPDRVCEVCFSQAGRRCSRCKRGSYCSR